MLKLVERIRSLAKSATDLASNGVADAAELLHEKLWNGAWLCGVRNCGFCGVDLALTRAAAAAAPRRDPRHGA
jgi:hypothetical protein